MDLCQPGCCLDLSSRRDWDKVVSPSHKPDSVFKAII